MKKKPNGTGRKKIEMKKIEKDSSRKVAFSKRRKGLFKKGSELCRLCSAMIGIIVFSPKGRVYTFGYPSVDYVIEQFMSEEEDHDNIDEEGGLIMSHETNVEDRVLENSVIENGSEKEEKGYWWEEDVEGLELGELEKRKAGMEELRYNLAMTVEEMMMRRVCERDFLGITAICQSFT